MSAREHSTLPLGALLVGSVPLADATTVFRMASATLGGHLRRLPDGETGERSIWIAWQHKVFESHPAFELEPPPAGQYAPLPRFRLRDGVDPGSVQLNRLGYAAAARASFEVFSGLKEDGGIPRDVRFQVSLPTPLAPVSQFVSHSDKPLVEPAYEAAMTRDVKEIADSIPHDELAIQWDVAVEMGMWEGLGGPFFETWFDDTQESIVERITRMAAAVPEDVELGFHLCYGDFGHEHFVQPRDAGNLVEIANAISTSVRRSIQWVHMPVPRDRDDDAYFAPLGDLHLHPETELYLGLVHFTDAAPGTRRRVAAAQRVVSEFGVATECGFGRRSPQTVEPLLRIHAEVAAPVRPTTESNR
jgi:hypothetical protein